MTVCERRLTGDRWGARFGHRGQPRCEQFADEPGTWQSRNGHAQVGAPEAAALVVLRGYGDQNLARPAASAALRRRAVAADVALVKLDAVAQRPDRDEPLCAGRDVACKERPGTRRRRWACSLLPEASRECPTCERSTQSAGGGSTKWLDEAHAGEAAEVLVVGPHLRPAVPPLRARIRGRTAARTELRVRRRRRATPRARRSLARRTRRPEARPRPRASAADKGSVRGRGAAWASARQDGATCRRCGGGRAARSPRRFAPASSPRGTPMNRRRWRSGTATSGPGLSAACPRAGRGPATRRAAGSARP